MNIIICDDRIDDRKNVSDLLSDYGEKKNYEFTITEYDSGEQLCEDQSALEACQLLFLDINMQGMDGLKTAMRIKEKYPKLPFVLVTAYMNYALDGDVYKRQNYDCMSAFSKSVFTGIGNAVKYCGTGCVDAPSSMRRRNVSRRASGVSVSPAPPVEMTPFWQ